MKKAKVITGHSVRVGKERYTEGESISVPDEEHENFEKLARSGVVEYNGVKKTSEAYKEQELDVDDDVLLGNANKKLEEDNAVLKEQNRKLEETVSTQSDDIDTLKKQMETLLANSNQGNDGKKSNQEIFVEFTKPKADEAEAFLAELSDEEVAELTTDKAWLKELLEGRLNG